MARLWPRAARVLKPGGTRDVSGDTIGRLIGRGHNSGRGGLGLLSYLLSALHYQTILYSRPRRQHYPKNLEIESYSKYIFPVHKSPITSKWPGRLNLDTPSIIALLLNALPTPSMCPKVLEIRASTGGNRAEYQVASGRRPSKAVNTYVRLR